MDVFIKYIIILMYKNQYERYENRGAGTGTGIESTPVPVPIPARGLNSIPVPIPIPVGGGDFPPMRGGDPPPRCHLYLQLWPRVQERECGRDG